MDADAVHSSTLTSIQFVLSFVRSKLQVIASVKSKSPKQNKKEFLNPLSYVIDPTHLNKRKGFLAV